jgi:hypothetical protein
MAGTAMPPQDNKRNAAALLAAELQRLGRGDLTYHLCFSDVAWREAMASLGCPAYEARLASPTARRGTRGKLGMATICHLRHGHSGVVYVRTHGRDWDAVAETVRHEALHLARPSYNHRQVELALGHVPPPKRRRRRRLIRF